MSLRLRLILAFFALSVVPLGAVTFYSYRANVDALRDAAEREADLLAGELGQRMHLVTAQLSERVEHLMDIAELQTAAEAASASVATSTAAAAPTTPAASVATVALSPTTISDSIAKSLGEAAMLLNNVELQNLRGGRRGGAPPPPGAPRPDRSGEPTRSRGPRPGPPPDAQGAGASRVQATQPPPRSEPPPPASGVEAPPATPQTTAAGAVPPVTAVDPTGKLLIDMTPIRREMVRQILPEGRTENLTPEERQRIAAEINQRMLGIAQGIKIGAAEIQKRAEEAQKAAAATEDKSAGVAAAQSASVAAATTATQRAASAAEFKRSSTVSGNRIDVKVERNGEVVRQMNAELNLPNVLATVFSHTHGERGELAFAVANDGTIYTRTSDDKPRVEALGPVATPDGPASARLPDWIVVTTTDTSGTGLRLGIARPVTDLLASLRRTTARNAGLGLLFIGVALVGIVPISSRLTRHIEGLSAAASRIAKGDYAARVPVKGRDEVGQLAEAFNRMAADVERHQRTAVEQERIRRELELGRQIQSEMLPHAPLHLGLTQVAGVSVPAREVGGDFFNYFVLDNGQVALLMGDVSGKGVGAALLMANIQAALRVRLGLGQDLSAVADAIDRDIDSNSPGPVYATLFIGILDPATRRLRYVNAGHNPQFVLRSGGLQRMPATGLPVGMLSGRGYSEQQLQLSAGDLLFFYTDGCVETENERGEMFGTERLEPLLVSAAAAADPLKHIEAGIQEFRGKSEPLDDATLMTVKVG